MSGITMDRQKLQALAAELAKDIKTEADLNALSRELLKLTVETALNAELTEHLGYEKHASSGGERTIRAMAARPNDSKVSMARLKFIRYAIAKAHSNRNCSRKGKPG